MCINNVYHQYTLSSRHAGKRVDSVLAECFPQYSRSLLCQWIKEDAITIQGQFIKPNFKVKGIETVVINAHLKSHTELSPCPIELNIIYEDSYLIIINKPANLVVHPGAGNWDNTLANALIYYNPSLKTLPRAGLIHRLDKDTTGLLIIAKTIESYHMLVKAMQERKIERRYLALVNGKILKDGTIQTHIGRDPKVRTKMSVVKEGKPAITHYAPQKQYNNHSLLEIKLETGRTHQIRVHLSYIKHPLVGDKTYGSNRNQNVLSSLSDTLQNFNRQALHAYRLNFIHPLLNKPLNFEISLPDDFKRLLHHLENSVDVIYP